MQQDYQVRHNHREKEQEKVFDHNDTSSTNVDYHDTSSFMRQDYHQGTRISYHSDNTKSKFQHE